MKGYRRGTSADAYVTRRIVDGRLGIAHCKSALRRVWKPASKTERPHPRTPVLEAKGHGSKPWPSRNLNLGKTMITSRNAQIAAEYVLLRTKLWPDVKEEDLWPRTKQIGYVMIPRTMPLVLRIMDWMADGKPVSRTYLDLWCRARNECVVKLEKHTQMAFYSGYRSQRAVQSWQARLRTLDKLGFISVKSGSNGPFSFALILNPHSIIKGHYKNRTSSVPKELYHTLIERGVEVKAKDL